jgi:4-hydroxybenzoate polyprenyltransferase
MVKTGLGDTYDKTVVPRKIRAYADLTKPASSIGVMLTIPFAALLYGELYHTGGVEFVISNWTTVLYASVTMLLLHGGSQAMNMAEDAYMDKQTDHKSTRPIPAGVVTEEEARSLAWIFIFLGVARAFTINNSFGIFCIILAFMGVMYNLSPIRAKDILWVNIGWQAASRGLFLFPATFAVWGDPLNKFAWSMGVVAFLLVLSMQQTADFADVEIDATFDITTPAVYYGLEKLVKIMALIAVLMFGVYSIFIYLGFIPTMYSPYLLVMPIGWSLYSLWSSPNSISEIGNNHFSWYVFYFSLACLYILPAVELYLTPS